MLSSPRSRRQASTISRLPGPQTLCPKAPKSSPTGHDFAYFGGSGEQISMHGACRCFRVRVQPRTSATYKHETLSIPFVEQRLRCRNSQRKQEYILEEVHSRYPCRVSVLQYFRTSAAYLSLGRLFSVGGPACPAL